jgi:hypothetical protein
MRAKLLAISLLCVECAVATYLALMAWILSSWMVDDGLAARLTPSGWYLIGAQRFGLVALVSTAFTCVAWVANRRWLPRAVSSTPRTLGWLAGGLGAAILLAGLVGSVHFVTRKPFF